MSNILMSYRHYSVSMPRYFRFALEKMGHKIWSVGHFEETIPWDKRSKEDQIEYFRPYWDVPNLDVPDSPFYPAEIAVDTARSEGFEPDLILSGDAGFALEGANRMGIRNAIILTDMHALPSHYEVSTLSYDIVIGMTHHYRKDYSLLPGKIERPVFFVPYGFDSDRHYWEGTDFANRPHDVCIISALLYNQRLHALASFEQAGLDVLWDSGLLYQQATAAYNQAVISFNWSSRLDLPARFWEGLATRNLVLTNRVPDLAQFPDLKEGVHYVAYGDPNIDYGDPHTSPDDLAKAVKECKDLALYYSDHRDEAWEIASAGFSQVWSGNHSYLQRTGLVMNICGMDN